MGSIIFRKKKSTFLLFLLPGVIWYSFVTIIPLITSFSYSFFKWSGGPNKTFIGLDNFKMLLQDEIFWQAFKNNLLITLLCVIGQIGFALIISSLLSTKFVKFKNIHRSVIFFPVVLSTIIIGFIWTMMYNKDYGIVNWFLQFLHLDFLIKPWLDDPKIVMLSISLPIIWQYIGYYMVIIMAGMTNISNEVFEMAEIDGATGFRKLIHITLPLLKNTIMVCIMLCIAGNMQVFSHIFVMTSGGPGTSSMVMAMYSYEKSFSQYQLGYGSAISIGILVVSLAMVFISRKLLGGKNDDTAY